MQKANWLPAIRGLRHKGGPKHGVGARYEVEAGFVGRHLRGILVCVESEPPSRLVLELEEGLDLTISVEIEPVSGGCRVELRADYSIGSGPFAAAAERTSQLAARREAARAVEQLAARFGRRGTLARG